MIFFYKYLNKFFLKSVITRRLILLSIDSFLIYLSLFLSNYFINNLFFNFGAFNQIIPIYLFCGLLIFIFSGQYNAITKYVGSKLFYSSLLRNLFLLIFVLLISLANKNN